MISVADAQGLKISSALAQDRACLRVHHLLFYGA